MSSHAHILTVLTAAREEFVGFLAHRLNDREVAEDLFQAAFVRATEHLHQLRDGESVVAWFYRILRNALADHWRAQGRRDLRNAALTRELDAAVEPPPELQAAVCRCVEKLLDDLKPEYAQALRRVDLEGAPVRAFADEIGITSNNAGVRLFRARDALRRQLIRCCGACAEQGCRECRCATTNERRAQP